MLCRQNKNAYSLYFLKHGEVIKELGGKLRAVRKICISNVQLQ